MEEEIRLHKLPGSPTLAEVQRKIEASSLESVAYEYGMSSFSFELMLQRYKEGKGDTESAFTSGGERYQTLLSFGKLFSFVGWAVVVLGGGGMVVLGVQGEMAWSVLAGIGVAIYGLLIVAGGQAISCFVSIENNTHATLLVQQNMLALMQKKQEG